MPRRKRRSVEDPSQRRLAIFSVPRSGKIARRFVTTLASAGRIGKSVKELAKETGVPLRTAYRAIDRLVEGGVVEKTAIGYTLSSVLGDVTTDPTAILGFENIRWTVSNWQTDPAPPCRTAKRWHRISAGDAGVCETTRLAWEGRDVHLRYFPDRGSLEVIIEARRRIPLLGAPVLEGWLVAMLGLGRGETSECTHVEINAVHEGFRADGFRYMEIRRFGEFAQVLYQRVEGLKHELRLYHPVDRDGQRLSVERSLEILTEGSPYAILLKIVREEVRVLELRIETEKRQAGLAKGVPPGAAEVRQPEKVAPNVAAESGFF